MSGCLDYRLSRRSMLGAAAGTFMGLGLRDLIARAGTDHAAKAEHVIMFWCSGGLSHIDTFDPKPGRPTQGEFQAIDTSAPGVQITEIFPQLAKQMHHVSLIRSVAGTQGGHAQATYQMQTSYNIFPNLQHPGLGNVVVHELDPIGDLPAFVSIKGNGTRAGYLGQRCEAFYVGKPGEKDPYLAFPSGIAQVRGNKRIEILEKMNQRFATARPDESFDATATATNDAIKLMRSPMLAAFDVYAEKPETLARYGENEFGRSCILAKRLVDQGVRFVQINRGGFDVHGTAFPKMETHAEAMDPAMASLIEDLAASGMLDKTLILVLSEFGRTPKINEDGGRDHHPKAQTVFMAGGGVKGGTVIGATDADGFEPADNPIPIPNVHATVCHALGIDPKKEVITPLQRPLKLVDNGEPVLEVFA